MTRGRLWLADRILFVILLIALAILIALFSQANIQSDSIDYYAILQKLTGNDHPPIVENLHFMAERSPGYSLAAVIPYCLVVWPLSMAFNTDRQISVQDQDGFQGMMQIPPYPLPSTGIFFHDFYLGGSIFQWKIILALLITSYLALFGGIWLIARTLRLESKNMPGISIILLVILASPIFMINVLQTPSYATLFAFGLSCGFSFSFTRACRSKNRVDELLCGLVLGALVLTRLETALMLAVVMMCLAADRDFRFCKNLAAGAITWLPVLFAYNMVLFGNPFHASILAGDINLIMINPGYISDCLINPASGVVFWSTLTVLGIIGLCVGRKERHQRVFLACSAAMIGLYLVRVPVMYLHTGAGTMEIGGIPIGMPATRDSALALVRSDMNRYLTLLVPFAVLGLQGLPGVIFRALRPPGFPPRKALIEP
ncbi:MAG TPA: hypothetical protein VK436_01790 [Methanocella sp.]|nr:hypothetical protein [Methanocella sp.]